MLAACVKALIQDIALNLFSWYCLEFRCERHQRNERAWMTRGWRGEVGTEGRERRSGCHMTFDIGTLTPYGEGMSWVIFFFFSSTKVSFVEQDENGLYRCCSFALCCIYGKPNPKTHNTQVIMRHQYNHQKNHALKIKTMTTKNQHLLKVRCRFYE